jgi:hypothetical protein
MHLAIGALMVSSAMHAHPQAPTQPDLVGSWEVKLTAATGLGSKTEWFPYKTPRFMVYTFHPDGTWSLEISPPDKAARVAQHGTFSIKGKKVVLNKDDGAKFDEWKADLTDGGLGLSTDDGKLLMKLTKLPTVQ